MYPDRTCPLTERPPLISCRWNGRERDTGCGKRPSPLQQHARAPAAQWRPDVGDDMVESNYIGFGKSGIHGSMYSRQLCFANKGEQNKW